MGRPKAWLLVDGEPMAARVASVLAAGGCSPVRFVGATPDADLDVHTENIPDHEPGAGPLGGVLTALRSSGADVVVAACDLVAIDPDDVRALLEADPTRRAHVVVATAHGHHVPLALWRRSALSAVTELFTSGARSWRAALEVLERVEVPISGEHAHDVDTPADFRRVAGGPPGGTAHCDPPDARR
jgi:molybdenum cofactor guanylyltransferase